MNRFVLLIAFAAVAYSAPVQDDNMCCPPDKFQTTIYGQIVTIVPSINSTNKLITYKYVYNVDYAREQIAVLGQLATGEKVHMVIRPNYTYAIDDDKQSCVVRHDVPYTAKKCVPKSATYVGDIIYGNLTVKAYTSGTQEQSYAFAINDDCLSVTEIKTILQVQPKASFVTTNINSDIKPGVTDSAFDVPSYCPKP